ncbi:MAG TPA: PQQ-binding-like beta-propeller repeat protein [Polyangia bacterium]|nr:PQQ-binding-like beta-propeller repeat protein [Polyangia bacterium]
MDHQQPQRFFAFRHRSPSRAWLPLALTIAGWTLPARADDWPTSGLDAAHTRASAERSGAAFSDGTWTFLPKSDAGALASPVAADGVIVTVRLDGAVTALAEDSGGVLWQQALGVAVHGTPAIASGRLFVPTLGNKMIALGLADGHLLWKADLGGMTVSSPAVVGGDIIVGAGLPRQVVVRLSGATGALVWSTPVMEQFSNTPPAVGGGLAVVGTNGGHYYAFDAASGALRWDYRADGVVNIAAPVIAGGRVYMAGGEASDHVHAVDAATGAPLAGWPIALPAPAPDLTGRQIYRRRAVSSLAFAGGLVVLSTRLDDAIDTDSDGAADHHLSRETALALDPVSGTVAWQHALARVVFTDVNSVPGFMACPTPAAFAAGKGQMVAVASSLIGQVSVLDAASGVDRGDIATAGRALASPVVANGRLITVAEDGTVEARLSGVNHPPASPRPVASAQPLDAAAVKLQWAAAMDPDGDQASYEVRVDTDGEVLQSWTRRVFAKAGVTSASIPGPLTEGITYTFAVRARDDHGAYSTWSAPTSFTVAASGAVTLDGLPVPSLSAAVAAASPGSIIGLGSGTFRLAQTLAVPAGVRIAGAGAGRTMLSGTGLSVAVRVTGGDAEHPAGLDRVTVTGAETCISVEGTPVDASLTHLVVHDCATAGIAVASDGRAIVKNATIVADGTGVTSSGAAIVRNSLIAHNQVGLAASDGATLVASYNDLFANAMDRQGVAVGPGDLAVLVTFADAGSYDYRLSRTQATTDAGDPADDAADEPAPNGSRINLGAFGGTAEAEMSAPAVASSQPGAPAPVASQTQTTASQVAEQAAGCAVAGSAPRTPLLALGLGLWLVGRRRRRGRME